MGSHTFFARTIAALGFTLLFAAVATNASFAASQPGLDGASWVWHGDAGTKAGTWYFQKAFDFPAGKKPDKAHVVITCDNLWTMYVNGNKVGQNDPAPDSWRRPQSLDVANHLVIEKNSIAIEGTNTIPRPSGLIAKLVVRFEDGDAFQLTSDGTWISTDKPDKGWTDNGFIAGDDWKKVRVIGAYGAPPWGSVTVGSAPPRGRAPRRSAPAATMADAFELAKPAYQAGVVFVGNAVGLNVSRQPIYVQNIRGTRGYFEMDPMTPAALGRQLWSLVPLRPDGEKTLLCDAGNGTIGSPSVSFDGTTVYFTMARAGEAYFHIYKIDMNGTGPRAPGQNGSVVQVTSGPFHDYDPTELPDGRIVFSSTRLGSREEYHAKYASSLFTCAPDGTNIRPLTYHIVADREPRVTADGSLVFIRTDNFLERAKVEVHLHQTHLDGTAGQVIIGPGRTGVRLDRSVAAEPSMRWLRKFGIGSPAPMPDGRVIAINQKGLVTSADPTGHEIGSGFVPFDLSPLPDGRLLCTSKSKNQILVFNPWTGSSMALFTMNGIHSVVSLAEREKPIVMPSMVKPELERRVDKTGYLYCQNVLSTQHIAADTRRITAVRIFTGRPFTLEPTKSIYEHIGTVGVELGTVPLEEDGSFYVEVPADRPLAMQAVDGEGRAVINELSWIYTRPGEQRGCVGCHAPVGSAPLLTGIKAMKAAPLKLLGQGDPHRFRANNGANGGIANLQLDKFREVVSINLHEVPNDTGLSTIRRLGISRDRSAVPVLVKALEDKSPEVRVAAALSLSACGDRRAVAPLMKLLNDPHRVVARAATSALSHLTGNPRGGIDWAAMEAALIEKVSGIDQQDAHMAIEALGHVGSDAGKKAIRDYLTKNPQGSLRILMAAMRSLGYLQDREAVPDLVKVMNGHLNKAGRGGWGEGGFRQKPTYLSATAAEALGRIGGADAEREILASLGRLANFESHVMFTGDHGWLRSAQASAVYFRMLEALDRMKSTGAGPHTAKIVESIPSDKDRGLLYELDTYEKLVGRVIERSGTMNDVVAACFAVLGEPSTRRMDQVSSALKAAVSKAPHNEKHIRKHSAQSRAAQVLSIVCNDAAYADRIRAVLLTYRAQKPSETRSWTCFMLTRALGRLGDTASIDLFIEMLVKDPTEASLGLNPPPAHIIYKAWRPFHRPAAAWSLGQLKAKKAVPALLAVLQDLDNASSTREQAAIALGRISDTSVRGKMREIAEEYPEVTTRRALLEAVATMPD
jgi:HEAT repeat protein